MISINQKQNCCGCRACEQACPKNCITMEADSEGFLYPVVDESRCISCGLCNKTCPVENPVSDNDVIDVYATQNKDQAVRAASSSGGTFRLLCNKIFEAGGIVYGCAFDENMVAKHIAVESEEEMPRLQSSKYVQSDVQDTYSQVKEQLERGRKVLFSGTPCQVAGLKNFLKKDYENLLLVDLLCHGVPSPEVFKQYKISMEKKYNGKMISLNLRDKKKSWKRLFVNAKFDNGKGYFLFCGYDYYLSMFLNNISQRPSCFSCPFTSTKRHGDITLGDFWGIGNYIRCMDDDKGTSLIITNTKKGALAFDAIAEQMKVVKTSIDVAISGNKILCNPPKKNINRDAFYEVFAKEGYESAANKYANVPSKPMQWYYTGLRKCLDVYRFVFRKTY